MIAHSAVPAKPLIILKDIPPRKRRFTQLTQGVALGYG